MSAGFTTTNLGEQAQAIRVLAESVSALNYQQPFLQLGTFAAPLAAAAVSNITFDAGYSKYIVYILAPASTVNINNTFNILSLPVDYVGTHTISQSVKWILTGATPTFTAVPLLTTVMGVFNDTVAPALGSSISLLTFTPAGGAPIYSSGTAVLKIVINLNLD